MNYIFFGTPEFAAIILEKLIKAGLPPQIVVCNPDKPVGRKKIITPPAVKKLLNEKFKDFKIVIYQPESLEIENWRSEIGKIKNEVFDFFVVAAYSKILPKEILEIPRLGVIGVHPSLLPKYRGPSPIQTAILNGEEKTGVTIFLMDEKVDHGPILVKRELEFPISGLQFPVLSQKLAELGADLLIKTLPDFVAGKITPLTQDESQATYTKKFKTEDAYIELKDLEIARGLIGSPQEIQRLALEIDRKIRAFNPEPGMWTLQGGKRMRILEAILTPEANLKLKKIQFEGKKPIFLD